MAPTRGLPLGIHCARLTKPCANGRIRAVRRGQPNVPDLTPSAPALQRPVGPRPARVIVACGYGAKGSSRIGRLELGVLALAIRRAVRPQDACMRGAHRQFSKWTWPRVRSSVVVLTPAMQVAGNRQTATVLGPGANRGKRQFQGRGGSLIGVPSPTDGGAGVQRAGVVPTCVQAGEPPIWGFQLVVVIVAPARNAAIQANPARETTSGRNLPKPDVGRNIQLPVVVVRPPAERFALR